jgi:hypothetical protein
MAIPIPDIDLSDAQLVLSLPDNNVLLISSSQSVLVVNSRTNSVDLITENFTDDTGPYSGCYLDQKVYVFSTYCRAKAYYIDLI